MTVKFSSAIYFSTTKKEEQHIKNSSSLRTPHHIVELMIAVLQVADNIGGARLQVYASDVPLNMTLIPISQTIYRILSRTFSA